MATVFGADSIIKQYPEGLLSGEGDTILTRGATVKTSTAITAGQVLVTPLLADPLDADDGLVTGLAEDTDFATHYICGIAAYDVASVAAEQKTAMYVKGGFKYDKILDAATLLTPDNLRRMMEIGLYVTDPMLQVGGIA